MKSSPDRQQRVLAKVWLNIKAAAFCVACESIFTLGESVCPACGSGQWIPLTKWFK